MERHKTLSDYKAPGPKVRVGADIDAWCTRCRMVLTHTIIAMEAGEPVRAECNTCRSQHKYRQGPPGLTRSRTVNKSSGTWAPPQPKRPDKLWRDATADKDLSTPITYHPKTTFETDQVILHGKFGIGVVIGLKEGGKIFVVFEDGTRVLVHGRG